MWDGWVIKDHTNCWLAVAGRGGREGGREEEEESDQTECHVCGRSIVIKPFGPPTQTVDGLV